MSASRRILPTEDAMATGNGRGKLEHLIRESLAHRWWSMSPTSQFAHHPFGAAVARLSHPAGASGGGGEGWSIPLVSRSERTRRRLAMNWSHCGRGAQTFVRVREPTGTSVRASEVGSIFVGVPVGLLCVATMVFAWHGEAPRGGGLATAALTAAILAVVSLLAGAVWLSIADWMVEIRTRATWAAIAAVECGSVPLADAPDQYDYLYQYAGEDDEAVRAVLRTHCHSVPSSAVKDVTGIEGADERVGSLPSVPPIAQLAAAASCAERRATDNGCNPTRTPAMGAALRVVSGVNKTRPEVRKAFRAVASAVAASGRKGRAARIATGCRRTVNGSRGDAGPDLYPTLKVMGLPIKIVSDIFIRAQQGEDGPEERLPRPKLDSDRIRAGPPICGSNGPAEGQARHQSIACANAKRQVIALAEALARQAAREDDAAEHIAERSASADADTLASGRNGGDSDASG